MHIPRQVLVIFELAINKALTFDVKAQQRLVALAGKVVKIDIRGLNISLYVLLHHHGVQLSSDTQNGVDVTISGAPISLLCLAQMSSPTSLHGSGVTIDGDLGVGQQFQQCLMELAIDWEEILAGVCGDVLAHRIMSLANDMMAWGQTTLSDLNKDVADYLIEEQHHLPAKAELELFLRDVDEMRADTDRLSQRISRLAAKIEAPNPC